MINRIKENLFKERGEEMVKHLLSNMAVKLINTIK